MSKWNSNLIYKIAMEQWRTEGWAILPRFLNVDNAIKVMQKEYPLDTVNPKQDFGSDGSTDFPCKHDAINRISVHPKLIDVACDLLGTSDIELSQSVAWAKYGLPAENEQSNRDQRIHMDYGNHYWTHPPPFDRPDAVAAIIYYSDTTETGGVTAIVPRKGDKDPVYRWPYLHMPGISWKPFFNDRNAAEKSLSEEDRMLRKQCYEREIMPILKPGDVLLYRLDVWHRGTPVFPGKVRYVHNLLWKRRDAHGMCLWNSGWTQKMYYGWLEDFICSLSEKQRKILGFPPLQSLEEDVRMATIARYKSRL